MRRRFVKLVGLVVLGIVLLIQLIRPARTNPPVDRSRSLTALVAVPSETARILNRACRDCHTNETRWPWYSNVAPVSWFVIEHVNHGRSHLNFSDWAQYTPSDATKLIDKTCELTRKGDMPMGSYTWIHTDARLAPAEVEMVCAWADGHGN